MTFRMIGSGEVGGLKGSGDASKIVWPYMGCCPNAVFHIGLYIHDFHYYYQQVHYYYQQVLNKQ